MIQYPAIEQNTKSNREINSPAPREKASPNGETSFHELTIKANNNVDESETPIQQFLERVVKDESDEEQAILTGETVVAGEFLVPDTLVKIVQIPLVSPLPAGSSSYESQFATSVEQALAVAMIETQPDASQSQFSVNDNLRTAFANSATKLVEANMATTEEWSQPATAEITSFADADAAKLMTSLVKNDPIHGVQIEQSATEFGRIVVQRVSETLIHEIPLAENDGFKRITLNLHPAELGKLTLYVGWENETVKARIVASEFATSELLNREKNVLEDAMQAQGLNFESLDVSYEGSAQNRGNWDTRRRIAATGGRAPVRVELAAIVRSLGSQGSVINIIV